MPLLTPPFSSEYLDEFDREEYVQDGRYTTRIWVQQTVQAPAPVAKSERLRSLTRSLSSLRARSTLSLHRREDSTDGFPIEGPRLSDETDDSTEGRARTLTCPKPWSVRNDGIRVVDTFSVSSHQLPTDAVPPLPHHGIPSEWNEEARPRTRSSSLGRIGQFFFDKPQ
jgi:hypothetical protein